jgi:FMN phosphatase YigB (HAD superfamily)
MSTSSATAKRDSKPDLPMQPILLFDVMDTLVYNPFNREIPEFFGCTQTELVSVKHPLAWRRFETGEIDESEYLSTCFADGRTFDQAAFLKRVSECYRWIDGSEQMLERLCNRGYEIHALSNYPIWYQTIENRLQLSRYLQWTFVSCLTGVRKPASEAFLRAAQHLNRSPESCLFIDDSAVNCEAAISAGMSAIRFFNAADVWTELQRHGIC